MNSPQTVVFSSVAVGFSSVAVGFEDYKINSAGAWCTNPFVYDNAWLKILFEDTIKVYAVGVGAPNDTSILSFPKQFKAATKPLDSNTWSFVYVGHTEVSFMPVFH